MPKDAAARRNKRSVLAFFLYICITIAVFSAEFLLVAGNSNTFVKEFTNASYVENLRADIAQYTSDLCKVNSVPDDFIDEVVTYNNVYNLENAYISGEFNSSEEFSTQSHSASVKLFEENVEKSVAKMLKKQNISVSDAQIKNFSGMVAGYADRTTQFGYIEQLKSFCRTSKIVCSILLSVCSLVGIGLVIGLFTGTSRKYRATRSVSYALLSSAVMSLLVALAVFIVKSAKQLVIYPSYLVDVFIRWADASADSVLVGAGVLFAAFAFLASVTWKLKRDIEE